MKDYLEFLKKINWRKQILFLIFISFCITFFFQTYSYFVENSVENNETHFSIKGWLIIADLILVYVFLKFKLPFFTVFVSAFFLFFISIFITITLPDPHFFIGYNYEGIVYQETLDTHTEEMENGPEEIPDFYPSYGNFFSVTNPELRNEIENLKTNNERVWTEKFYFWQTGYLLNFRSEELGRFYQGSNFSDLVSWFFVLGPPILIEMCLESLLSIFLGFLILFLLLSFSRREKYFISFDLIVT